MNLKCSDVLLRIEEAMELLRKYCADLDETELENNPLARNTITATLDRASMGCVGVSVYLCRSENLGLPRNFKKSLSLLNGKWAEIINSEIVDGMIEIEEFCNTELREFDNEPTDVEALKRFLKDDFSPISQFVDGARRILERQK